MILCRKRLGAKDTSPTPLAPLVINRPSAYRTVRYLHNGIVAAFLFEKRVWELPTDRPMALGLTPREADVVR